MKNSNSNQLQNHCIHSSNNLNTIHSSNNFLFCKNCGLILFKQNGKKILSSYKPYFLQSKTEISPIEIYKNYINSNSLIKTSADSLYAENRWYVIKMLEEFNRIYHFSDEIFYLALTYLDIIFYKLSGKSLMKKDFDLYILNSLFLAEKFYEKDIDEYPDYSLFIEKCIYQVSVKEIAIKEVECLKKLNYKLDYYSPYDLLKLFFYNGYVYEKEINLFNSNSYCTMMNNYAYKIFRDVIYSNLALTYPSYQIVISIIQLTRKKFNLDMKYMKLIKKIYNIKTIEYKDCLEDIKKLIQNIENYPQSYEPMFNNQVSSKFLFINDDEKSEKENKKNVENSKNEETIPINIDLSMMKMETPILNNVKTNRNIREMKLDYLHKTKKTKKLKYSKSFNNFSNIFDNFFYSTKKSSIILKCSSFNIGNGSPNIIKSNYAINF